MTDGQSNSESTTVVEPESSRQKASGVAASVLGITGVIAGVFSSLFWLAGIFGLAGLVVGLAGRTSRGSAANWWRVIGLILSSAAVVLSGVGLMFVLDVFRNEDVSSPSTPGTESTAPGPTPSLFPQDVEQEPAGIGEAAVDGAFTFVVTAVTDDHGAAGVTAERPQGRFVYGTMTVTNVGAAPASVPAENQYVIDTAGRTTAAVTDLPEPSQSIFAEIEPGESLTGVLVFDIPADAVPADLELHGSASSAGVTVALQ